MAQNSQIAFAPLGNTVVIPAAAVASTGVQALVDARFDAQATGQYRIINSSANTVFLGVGPTAAIATRGHSIDDRRRYGNHRLHRQRHCRPKRERKFVRRDSIAASIINVERGCSATCVALSTNQNSDAVDQFG